jgi:acyl-CoA hydrolase
MATLLDRALAKRRDELTDVKIRGNLLFGPIECVECDPTQEHFIYNSWHLSAYERKLADRGLCYYMPMVFRNEIPYYKHFLKVNVAFIGATPMDKHGYFNLSTGTGTAKGIADVADVVIIEVNENLPRVHGYDEVIHISEVDMIVEGEHGPLHVLENPPITENDMKVAENIIPYFADGCALQLGIGGMPNAVGQLIAKAGIRDITMHTELCCDAFLDLHEAGVLTNVNGSLQKGKGVFGIAFGRKELYDWIDENPNLHACPLEYVNSPTLIGKLDNMMSINGALSCDLYGQVCSESIGRRQISGTGGQLDYLTGAAISKGGKAFLCMESTYTDKKGNRSSRILPWFGNGDIITSPRSQAYFIVTEYGAVNLVGRSTWERAEMLVSIAHPDYREGLIKAAEEQKIWRRSNKLK